MPSSISFQKFFRVLKILNPRFRHFPAIRGRGAMLYITEPRHPDCNRLGLNEVLAYPSQLHASLPKYDFWDLGGKRGRGYSAIFKMLVRKRLINREKLVALVPDALDPGISEPALFHRVEACDVPKIPIHRFPVREREVRLRRSALKIMA